MKDLKRALGTGEKPDITHVRKPALVYPSRAGEYGSAKYVRSNYLRSAGDHMRDDFERLRGYLRASMSHIVETLDSMEAHQANDPGLDDIEGMKTAAYAADTDPDTSGKVGPSGLPHLCGGMMSLNMAITQAVAAGLLPADPGQPWVKPPEKECQHPNRKSYVYEAGMWYCIDCHVRVEAPVAKQRCRCGTTLAAHDSIRTGVCSFCRGPE